MKTIYVKVLAFFALCLFAVAAFAADAGVPVDGGTAAAVVDPATNANGFMSQIFAAVSAHRWDLVAVLGVIALVSFLRWVAPKLHDKFGELLNSNRGGSVLALLNGLAMAIATTLLQGGKLSPQVVTSGLAIGIGGSGSWNVLWDLLAPSDKKAPLAGAQVQPPTPPIVRASMFLPFLIIGSLISGCLYCKAPEHKSTVLCKAEAVASQCGESGVAKVVMQILPDVIASLLSTDWSNLTDKIVATLSAQGVPDALGVVACAVRVAESNATPPPGAAVSPENLKVKKNAQAWLAAHAVK